VAHAIAKPALAVLRDIPHPLRRSARLKSPTPTVTLCRSSCLSHLPPHWRHRSMEIEA